MRLHPDMLASRTLGAVIGRDASFLPSENGGLVRRANVFSITGIGNAGNIVDLVICLLSFCGALIIILPYVLSKNSRKLRHALIVGLATSDLIGSVVIIITTSCILAGVDLMRTNAWCAFLGYVLSVSVFSQHLWNLGIALITYMILVHPLSSFTLTVERRLIWLWPLFWGIAFAAHGLAWIKARYRYVGGYCTMYTTGSFTAVFQFVPRAVVTLIVVVLYTHLFFFLRRTNFFKAASGSHGRSSSKSSPRQVSATGSAERRGTTSRTRTVAETGNGVGIDGQSFATMPYVMGSSNSSTTEGITGSVSSKRSLRTRFFAALGHGRDADKIGDEGQVEVISDADAIPLPVRKRSSPQTATIELQKFASSSTLNQRNTQQEGESQTLASDGAVTAVRGTDAAIEALRDEPGANEHEVSSHEPGSTESGTTKGPATLSRIPTLSPPSSPTTLNSREGLSRVRSASNPPALGLGQRVSAAVMGGAEPAAVRDRELSSQDDSNAVQRDAAQLVTDAASVTSSLASLQQSKAEDSSSLYTTYPSRRSRRGNGAIRGGLASSKKRPSTTDSYNTRAQKPSIDSRSANTRAGRSITSSSHTYRVGGKTGRRMLARRASFGDLSEGSGSEEDMYSFRPMRPRKDVSDFDMTSAPREHLKHLNAPKVWANMAEVLAMGDGNEAEGSAANRGDGTVAVPMPITEKDFEQALGDDWAWGMDVTSPRRQGPDAGTSTSRKLPVERHGGGGSGAGQYSNDTTASSSSDGQGVESLGSTLNRQASLLMLLYPAAYVLLFSLSIIRIIDDLASASRRTRSQEVLHTLSRWFIFAQGLLDAIIFQFVEKQFRKRMKRRRRRAMGEQLPDPFWTKVAKDTAHLVKRLCARGSGRTGEAKPSAEAEEMAFRRGVHTVPHSTTASREEQPQS